MIKNIKSLFNDYRKPVSPRSNREIVTKVKQTKKQTNLNQGGKRQNGVETV